MHWGTSAGERGGGGRFCVPDRKLPFVRSILRGRASSPASHLGSCGVLRLCANAGGQQWTPEQDTSLSMMEAPSVRNGAGWSSEIFAGFGSHLLTRWPESVESWLSLLMTFELC